MAKNCTILCPADEPARVVDVVRESIGDRGLITVDGEVEDWSSITIENGDVSMVLNRLVFVSQGDEFSKMQGGIWRYFDGVETVHASIKSDLLERIDGSALAIGVVAEPGFVEDSGHYDCIFGLAGALDAVIWTGNGIIDAQGQMILDGDGESEVAG
jgi:hypothetical protein